MLDPDPNENADHRRPGGFRGKWVKVIVLACLALVVADWIVRASSYRRPYTCAVCRADKMDCRFLGRSWSRVEGTECSRWYGRNIEPNHAHVWIKCTYCRRLGLLGLGGLGCAIGGPLTGLSRRVQMTIYQHFDNPLEAKRLFIDVGQQKRGALELWEALMDWVEHDYPGTWQDWKKLQGL